MAHDVLYDTILRDHERQRDDSSDDNSNSARRAACFSKGKYAKQSTGVRPTEEPISQQSFEEFAHTILRAVGSRVPEPENLPMAQDTPKWPDKQLIPHTELP